MEIWKDIAGFPNYQVSNLGRVKSAKKILKPIFNKTYRNTGYYKVSLHNPGKVQLYIHRLVATAFIPNPNNKPHVNHIDSNKANNRVNNLEWATVSENNIHAFQNGKKVPCGQDSVNSKLTTTQVLTIKKRLAAGEHFLPLSKEYGVSDCTIRDIKDFRTWKHLKNQAA